MPAITAEVRQRMVDIAAKGAPMETVGLVLQRTGVVVEQRVLELINESPEPTRTFLVRAPQLRFYLAEAERDAWKPVALWHSHPSRPAQPSHSDIAGAFWDAHFIVAPTARPGREVRFWRIADGKAQEEPVDLLS